MKQVSYVIVTGGVVSGLGKGTVISSLGALLRHDGFNVTAVKIDPYLNVDAGTMSPGEHGEVFVLADGGEVDLDLGCYERFMGIELTSAHSITSGRVFSELVRRERRGDYLGKTVQLVPHATDLVQEMIEHAASQALPNGGVCLVELGGTVGDIESMVFLRALRDMRMRVPAHFAHIHVSLVPTVGGEQKTKPTQHSVARLRQEGLDPTVLVCRSALPLQMRACNKLRRMCQVEHVVSLPDAESLYHVPTMLRAQRVDDLVGQAVGLARGPLDRDRTPGWWRSFASHYERTRAHNARRYNIAVVGKYVNQQADAYLSLKRAIAHAAHALDVCVHVMWFDTDQYETDACPILTVADAIVVPGGFGVRGFEQKVGVIRHVREHGVPFLGLCLGFQAAVVEYARHVLGDARATTEEFGHEGAGPYYIVNMPETCKKNLGGTMRLGRKRTMLASGTFARALYDADFADERHRHRYEVNPTCVARLEKAGLLFSGRSVDGKRMETLEIPGHPFFIGTQYHPEYTSAQDRPHPLFKGLIRAAAIRHDRSHMSS